MGHTDADIPFGPTEEERARWAKEAEGARAPSFSLEPRATVDFETRSGASIRDVGAWRYCEDPSTEPLCMCYRLPHYPEGEVRVWHPAFPEHGIEETSDPEDLFQWIAEGGLVEAHNISMELAAWHFIMRPRHGWPELPLEQLRCSAAKAAAHALPRALEDLARVLKVRNQKDLEGSKVMKKMTKPRKLRKKERADFVARGVNPDATLHYHFTPELFDVLVEYCQRDVLAEEDCSHQLRDLNPLETEVFLLDLRVNMRGVHCDRAAVEAALGIVDHMTGGMTAELPDLTGGFVERASQRARVLQWVNENGVAITDTQGATVDEALRRQDLPHAARRVLEICRAVNRSSTAKYVAMHERMSPRDDAIRGMLVYHGASTGRWTGAGVQPHNFPRGEIKDMDAAWEALLTQDVDWIETLYGDVMETLSHATRGAFVAPPGFDLMVADYSAIESRVIFWLAEEAAALEVFRRGECIYCDMATGIYKRPVKKKEHPTERQLGKQAILGLGFGMGAPKFVVTCAKYGIVLEEEFSKFVVDTYRAKYPRVKAMWYAQEEAACEAVKTRRTIKCGRVSWRVVGRFLHCKLPSGRLLSYCDPRVLSSETPWGAMKDVLTFMSVNPLTRQWTRTHTYGGMIVENIVQAVARDLLAEAGLRAERSGVYSNAFSVHDELVTYVPEGVGDVHEFERLMSVLPPWADGCPVGAEGWRGKRYRK